MAACRLERVRAGQGTVRPGGVVVAEGIRSVLKVFGQHLAQVMLIDDQQPVEELAAQSTDDPGACNKATGRRPSRQRQPATRVNDQG